MIYPFRLLTFALLGAVLFSSVGTRLEPCAWAQNPPDPMNPDTAHGQNQNGAVKVMLTVDGQSKKSGGALIPINDDWDEENRAAPVAGATLGAKVGDNQADATKGDRILVAAENAPEDEGDNELVDGKVTFEAQVKGVNNKIEAGELKGGWSLSFPDKVKVWQQVTDPAPPAGGPTTKWQQVVSGARNGGAPAGGVPAPQDVGLDALTLKVEGVTLSTALMAENITASFTLNDNQGSGSDEVPVTVFKVNLSANVGEVDDEMPGAAVVLNDDNDNENVYPDYFPQPRPAGIKWNPYEPIWDNEEDGPIENENDLIPISMTVSPSALATHGFLLLESDEDVRLWKSAQKGSDNKMGLISNVDFTNGTAPQVFAEGINGGSAAVTLQITAKNKIYTDVVDINVVSLSVNDNQNFAINAIPHLDNPIPIKVEIANADGYSAKWDLNGNGQKAEAGVPFEDAAVAVNLKTTRLINYGTDTSTQKYINWPENKDTKHKTTIISAELEPSGLVISTFIRIKPRETKVNMGDPSPENDNDILKQLYTNWDNDHPIKFDDVGAPGPDNNIYTKVHDYWGADKDTDAGYRLQFGKKFGVGTGMNGNSAAGYTLSARTPVALPESDQMVYCVLLNHQVSDLYTKDELDSTIEHEKTHTIQGAFKRRVLENDVNTNYSIWRLMFENAHDEELSFEETQAYGTQLKNDKIHWSAVQADSFRENFNESRDSLSNMDNNPILALTAPVNTTRFKARKLLQDIYKAIPYQDLKNKKYAYAVRAPE